MSARASRELPFTLVALAALASVACSPEPAPPGDLATAAGFCQAVLDGDARKIAACTGASAADAAALWASETAGACRRLAAMVEAGTVRYDAARAPACLDARERAPCLDLEDASTPACDAVLTGTVSPGGACRDDVECAGGHCFEEGGPCDAACVADLRAGDRCVDGFSAWCGAGLVCDAGGTGTCVPAKPAAVGAPCGPGWEEPCVAGAWCDAGGTCRAKLGAGESCLGAWDACGPGTACHASDDETRAECVPWSALGDACGEWTGRCAPGLECAPDGRCARAPRLGEPCAASGGCFLAWCDPEAGRCASPKPDGASCTASDQCAAESYCAFEAGPVGACASIDVCGAAP